MTEPLLFWCIDVHGLDSKDGSRREGFWESDSCLWVSTRGDRRCAVGRRPEEGCEE